MAVVGETVTVSRYDEDRYGDRVKVAEFAVHHCAFAARSLVRSSSTENADRSEQVRAQAEMYAPYGSGIEASDVVVLADGTEWEVEGRPETWRSPFTTWRPGDVVLLSRTTG